MASGSGEPLTPVATSQIVLRAPEGEVGWMMIDMQGTLESRNGQPLDGVEFGQLIREVRRRCPQETLASCDALMSARIEVTSADFLPCVTSQDGIPKLVMGKNQLEGSEVKFKKPLAVMDLVKLEDGTSEYQLKGVIRSKVVFKARPVPRNDPLEPSTVGSKRTRSEDDAAAL